MSGGKVIGEGAKQGAKWAVKQLVENIITTAVTEGAKAAVTAGVASDIKERIDKQAAHVLWLVDRNCGLPNEGLSNALLMKSILPAISSYTQLTAEEQLHIMQCMLDMIEGDVSYQYGLYRSKQGWFLGALNYVNLAVGVSESWHACVSWGPVEAKLQKKLDAMAQAAIAAHEKTAPK